MQNEQGTQRSFLIITYCSSLLKGRKRKKGHKNFYKDYLMDEDIKVQFHLL